MSERSLRAYLEEYARTIRSEAQYVRPREERAEMAECVARLIGSDVVIGTHHETLVRNVIIELEKLNRNAPIEASIRLVVCIAALNQLRI